MPATNRFDLPIPDIARPGFIACNDEGESVQFTVGDGPCLWYWISFAKALKYDLRAGQNIAASGSTACFQFVKTHLPQGPERDKWLEYFSWFSSDGWHQLRMERYAKLGEIAHADMTEQRERLREIERAEEEDWERWIKWQPGQPRPDTQSNTQSEKLSTGNST